jgi:hypothetical protein
VRSMLVASISGILYALIAEIPLLTLSPPAPLSGTQAIVDYYVRYREVLPALQLMGSFGAMFLLVFLSGLSAYLGRLEGSPLLVKIGNGTAGTVVAALSLLANAATLSIVLNAGRAESAPAIQLLHDFTNATQILMLVPLAVVVGSTSWVLVRSQLAIRWIGIAGLPVAALLIFRALTVAGVPELPFPPVYPAWFEALAIGTAVSEMRARERHVDESYQGGAALRGRS